MLAVAMYAFDACCQSSLHNHTQSFIAAPTTCTTCLSDASGAGGDAGDEDAAPKFKPEIKVDESIWNVLFSAKARLHVRVKKDDGAHDWEPRGIGVLTVRQPKSGEGSDKAYVMFSTDVVRARS
jgi:hypothetical protein